MNCPECGAETLGGDRFCRRCGHVLAAAPQPAAAPARTRRPAWLTGSSLALLLIALVLFLAATNPSPGAYVAWAAQRLAPAAGLPPLRGTVFAIERSTVAESYGVCTVFQTDLAGGQTIVLGILDRFVPLHQTRLPVPVRRLRRSRRNSGGVQI